MLSVNQVNQVYQVIIVIVSSSIFNVDTDWRLTDRQHLDLKVCFADIKLKYSSLTCKDYTVSLVSNIKVMFWQTEWCVQMKVDWPLHPDEGLVHHAGAAVPVGVHHDPLHRVGLSDAHVYCVIVVVRTHQDL